MGIPFPIPTVRTKSWILAIWLHMNVFAAERLQLIGSCSATIKCRRIADLGEIQNLTVQAAGIGNNLNQIARFFHGGGLASRGMLEELKRCIAEIRELRQEIVQLGGVYRGNSKTHRK